jgi:hypothetical protein
VIYPHIISNPHIMCDRLAQKSTRLRSFGKRVLWFWVGLVLTAPKAEGREAFALWKER